MALVHDLAEADVGDITPVCGVSHEEKTRRESVRPSRRNQTKCPDGTKIDNHSTNTQAAMTRICSLLPKTSIAGLRLKSLWDEYEARETPEARIVKDLDMFELALQGVEYERRE